MRRYALIMFTLIVLVFGLTSTAYAATPPTNFADQTIVTGLSSPTAFAMAPDGRIFVLQQAGAVRIIKNGSLLSTPFLSLTVNANGERGLLGITFDPDFTNNQYIYLYYTANTPTVHNRVIRVTATGDVADVSSITPILDLETLGATNHNGGALHFGPDGKLYVAVGENAVMSNSQTLNNRLGKMLRINSDGTIPEDNPFYETATLDNRAIWALGLRNPYTFNFQPGTGRMFINDVGGGSWEEINDGLPGANYGWPATEGPTSNPAYVSPLHAYTHASGQCAITGGTFYNPQTAVFPSSYVGDYFFSDFCAGWIRSFDPGTGVATNFATGASFPVDLLVAPDGSLYYLSRGAGAVGRIYYTLPTITQHPANVTVNVGQSAQFDCMAVGEPTISYQWKRNGNDIDGATSSSYTLPSATLSDDGAEFRCIATNGGGSATSNAATLTVLNNQPPLITSANTTTFVIGKAGSFTVTATGNPAPTFGVSPSLPSGLSLNPTTGVISGTAAIGTQGTHNLTITADNGVGSPASQPFTLKVIPMPTWSYTSLGFAGCNASGSYFKTSLTSLVINYQYTGNIVASTGSGYYMAQTGPMKFTKTSGAMGVLLYANNSMGVSPMLPFPLPSGSPVQVILTIGTGEGTPLYRTTFNYVCNTGAVSDITSGPVP